VQLELSASEGGSMPLRKDGGREGGQERTGIGVSVLITLPGDVVLVGHIRTQELIEERKRKTGLVIIWSFRFALFSLPPSLPPSSLRRSIPSSRNQRLQS